MKEADTSFNNVLNGLFAPITRKRAKELGLNEVEESQYVGRLSREIEASGSMDKVAIGTYIYFNFCTSLFFDKIFHYFLGCFEHYTNLRNHDAAFEHHQKGSEWLVAFDMFSGAMRGDREYALMPYLAYTLVPFFPLFQERGGPKPERPKADWEVCCWLGLVHNAALTIFIRTIWSQERTKKFTNLSLDACALQARDVEAIIGISLEATYSRWSSHPLSTALFHHHFDRYICSLPSVLIVLITL
jgi:hypothetical protein